MPGKVVKVIEVIDIIDIDLVKLALLEEILNFNGVDPLRIQVVHDDFGTADLLPGGSLLFVDHAHAISSRKRIKVREIHSSKRQAHHIN